MAISISNPTPQAQAVLVPKTNFPGSSASQSIAVSVSGWDKITLYALVRSAIAAASDTLTLRINNNNAADYASTLFTNTRAGIAAGGNFNLTGWALTAIAGNTQPADVHSLIKWELYNLQGNAVRYGLLFAGNNADAATLNLFDGQSLYYNNNTAISTLNLVMTGGNIASTGWYTVIGENRV